MLGSSAATAVTFIAGVIGIVVGIAGIVSVVIVMAKQKALESSLGLFQLANNELRVQVDTGRTERHEQEIGFQKQLADERAGCARSLGVLQGQLDALTSSLGVNIAQSVVSAVGTLIEQARSNLAEKVDAVKADTVTANGLSIGELADQREGRRQRDEVVSDLTPGGQAYVDRIIPDHPEA